MADPDIASDATAAVTSGFGIWALSPAGLVFGQEPREGTQLVEMHRRAALFDEDIDYERPRH